ncbi:succinate dehydrogenase/fumarate reductase iron-sulfur subunit [Rapidithrix thailandica]|uniref:Fumarate reductase iron-sulfur subunit n=1 Tax=Rapidithrix thailandica TaxID=413964 RepID=A0AAW9RQM5_9BACT
MSERISLEVFRYNPESDTGPEFQQYEVPLRKDWVILDALNHIKDQLDGTLSYRWSCRMGVCGSCGMMVNGKPVLTCATFLEKFMPGPVRVEPLENFPVIRDLVIDMSDFLEKLKTVKPWIIREEEPEPERELLQTPSQLADYTQYSMCINCMLCYAACPIIGLEPDFVGPAAIALAQRYNLDNRDQGNKERREALNQEHGMWQCTFVGDCSVVCPKNVDPAGAIQRYKVDTASHWWKNLLLPWGTDKH